MTSTRQHNKYLLESIGYMFRPVKRSSSDLQQNKSQVLFRYWDPNIFTVVDVHKIWYWIKCETYNVWLKQVKTWVGTQIFYVLSRTSQFVIYFIRRQYRRKRTSGQKNFLRSTRLDSTDKTDRSFTNKTRRPPLKSSRSLILLMLLWNTIVKGQSNIYNPK